MLGAARTVQIAGWRGSTTPVANARRTGTSSTNASQAYTAVSSTTSSLYSKFGFTSQSVTTSGSYIYTSSGTPTYMNFGTGDFCIEHWLYIPALTSHSLSCDVMSNDTSGGFGFRLAQSYDTNGLSSGSPNYINIFARAQADLDYWALPTNWPTASWNFVVIQRKATTMSCWVNGTLLTNLGSGGGSRNFSSGTNIKIGTADGGNGVGLAYIDEFCVSNTYRYTDTADNIPVPTAEFTVDSYTTQLMHMEGTDGGTTFVNATS